MRFKVKIRSPKVLIYIALCRADGRSCKDIAARLGVDPSTVSRAAQLPEVRTLASVTHGIIIDNLMEPVLKRMKERTEAALKGNGMIKYLVAEWIMYLGGLFPKPNRAEMRVISAYLNQGEPAEEKPRRWRRRPNNVRVATHKG